MRQRSLTFASRPTPGVGICDCVTSIPEIIGIARRRETGISLYVNAVSASWGSVRWLCWRGGVIGSAASWDRVEAAELPVERHSLKCRCSRVLTHRGLASEQPSAELLRVRLSVARFRRMLTRASLLEENATHERSASQRSAATPTPKQQKKPVVAS